MQTVEDGVTTLGPWKRHGPRESLEHTGTRSPAGRRSIHSGLSDAAAAGKKEEATRQQGNNLRRGQRTQRQ